MQRNEALVHLDPLLASKSQVSLVAKFGYGVGNSVVKAAIEGSKLVHEERSIPFESEIGNRLAKVAVVVNNLIDGKSEG